MPDIILPVKFNNPNLPKVDRLLGSDNFNRADSINDLGVTPIGGLPWGYHDTASPTQTVQTRIIGNEVGIGSNGNVRAYATVDAGTPDVRMKWRYKGGATDSSIIIVARLVDENSMVHVYGNASGLWQMGVRTGGSNSNRQLTDQTITPGDVLELELRGTTVQLTVNGVANPPVEITQHASATRFGFGASTPHQTFTPNATWDDFEVIALGD